MKREEGAGHVLTRYDVLAGERVTGHWARNQFKIDQMA
jgi:hypothetical protein